MRYHRDFSETRYNFCFHVNKAANHIEVGCVLGKPNGGGTSVEQRHVSGVGLGLSQVAVANNIIWRRDLFYVY